MGAALHRLGDLFALASAGLSPALRLMLLLLTRTTSTCLWSFLPIQRLSWALSSCSVPGSGHPVVATLALARGPGFSCVSFDLELSRSCFYLPA